MSYCLTLTSESVSVVNLNFKILRDEMLIKQFKEHKNKHAGFAVVVYEKRFGKRCIEHLISKKQIACTYWKNAESLVLF